jgi:2-polyprenyl-3-methyl-5-hydroxy-6-metoxy-1,4-benzoquinol methylase
MAPGTPDYIARNRANWDSRVPHHAKGYGLERFSHDPAHLSAEVRFDRGRLGDIAGLDVAHLQCHIGHDTLSLARLGARVTGLDFSAPALAVARQLAVGCGATIEFVHADVHDAASVLGRERFDLVYTGLGALCWLPRVDQWAQVVAALLRPNGRLFLREGHPVLFALADARSDGLLVLEHPYFEVKGGTAFHEPTTYVEHDTPLESPDTIQFNHGLGEVFNALWAAGFEITLFEEHRSAPWNPLGIAFR